MILLTEEVEQVGHAPETFRGELVLYERELMSALAGCGFDHIKPVKSAKATNGPYYTAVREQQTCCICMQNEVTNILGLSPISNHQCAMCDALYARRDVYYTALLEEGGKLYLYRPVRLKSREGWLGGKKELEQYFPPEKCFRLTRFRALLGGFSEYKLTHFYLPLVREEGQTATTRIKGLGRLSEPPLALMCRIMSPHLCLLTKRVEGERPEVIRMFFYYEHGTWTELEVIRRVGEDATRGVVELMTKHGGMLYAESVDAAALPTKLRMPLRYTWSLCMVAERIMPLPPHYVARSETLFEIIRTEYRREHGEEMPPSYAENASTEDFLRLYQVGEGTRAVSVGCIVTLAPEKIFTQMHTVATVRVNENGDGVEFKLIISPELLGDYAPDVGDIIIAVGILQAVPVEALEHRVLWHTYSTSGEKKWVTHERTKAQRIYESVAPYSIGAAVTAAAFTAADWTVEAEVVKDNFARSVPAIIATDRAGKYMLVLHDTIINGHRPRFPHIGYEEKLRGYMQRNYANDVRVCYVYVILDYVPEYNHYKVAMKTEPFLPGVHNNIPIAACPFRDERPPLPSGFARYERSEVLNEAMAAELMFWSFIHGKWLDFALWLREELVYTTETKRSARYVGKMDFLRYICERIVAWKKSGAWMRLTCSTGVVPVDGVQRPAFALYDEEEIANLTIFGDSHGMIGSMRSLPVSYFPLYVQKKSKTPW